MENKNLFTIYKNMKEKSKISYDDFVDLFDKFDINNMLNLSDELSNESDGSDGSDEQDESDDLSYENNLLSRTSSKLIESSQIKKNTTNSGTNFVSYNPDNFDISSNNNQVEFSSDTNSVLNENATFIDDSTSTINKNKNFDLTSSISSSSSISGSKSSSKSSSKLSSKSFDSTISPISSLDTISVTNNTMYNKINNRKINIKISPDSKFKVNIDINDKNQINIDIF